MRRMTVIIQRMPSRQEAYRYDGVTEPQRRPDPGSPGTACELPDRAAILAAYLPRTTTASEEGKVSVPLLCGEER